MLSIRKICKNYGQVKVLEDVSFEVKQGEVVALLGLNGAGKTTLMRIVTGFLAADSGNVALDGVDLRANPEAFKARIGYLPEQAPAYPDMRVREFLAFMAALRGVTRAKCRERVREVVTSCGLQGMEDRLAGNLSKGYRHRLGIAQAMVNDPALLVLDEPTDGLDPLQKIEAREMISSLGAGRMVIVSTHILEEVHSMCNRTVALKNGRVAHDGPVPDDLTKIL